MNQNEDKNEKNEPHPLLKIGAGFILLTIYLGADQFSKNRLEKEIKPLLKETCLYDKHCLHITNEYFNHCLNKYFKPVRVENDEIKLPKLSKKNFTKCLSANSNKLVFSYSERSKRFISSVPVKKKFFNLINKDICKKRQECLNALTVHFPICFRKNLKVNKENEEIEVYEIPFADCFNKAAGHDFIYY